MTVERFLAKLSYSERDFLMSWDIERHITPAGLSQAAVWFCQNTCSAEMLRFLFPGVPVIKPRPGMLGVAMVDDLAHLLIPYASANGRTLGHVTTDTRFCALAGAQAPAPTGTTVADPSYVEDVGCRRGGRFVFDEVGRQLLLRTTKKGLPAFFWYSAETPNLHASSMTILIGDGPARGRVAHQVTVDDTRVVGALPPPPYYDVRAHVGPAARRLLPSHDAGAQSATSERIPFNAGRWADAAAVDSQAAVGERRVCTSVIDFSGFAASLSATLTGVYSHQLGGTVNGITYTSRLDQFGHFLVVPASSVLQPFGLSRRSEMHTLEEAFANVALGTTPVLRDTTVFRFRDVRQLPAGCTNGGYSAAGDGRDGAVQRENVSVTTHKAPSSRVNETSSTTSEAVSSADDPTSVDGLDRATSSDGADEQVFFELPSAGAVAAFSQMFVQTPAELA